ncbi:MAG: hypothetical protein Q4F21_12285, partial [Lachnospiraceae bacterium]|nr:hypothetical protein [Lachnospiraceae bacterium]
MDTRNTVEIVISGRRYKLSGNESAAYMEKVAEYVNNMYTRLRELPGFTSRSQDYQNLMMYLNLADDYLKKSGWTEEKQTEADTQAQEEIYRLKLELVEARKKAEAAEVGRSEETGSLTKQLEVIKEDYKRLSERDKEAANRTAGLEKELESYKTETAILKRKVSDYMKSASQVEKQLKDAAAREREEKLLRNKYETQLTKQKGDYETEISGLQKQLRECEAGNTELRNQLNNKAEAAENQEAKNAEAQKQLAEQKESYERQLAEQKQLYESLLAEQEKRYNILLAGHKETSESKLQEQNKAAETAWNGQKEAYEKQLSDQKE